MTEPNASPMTLLRTMMRNFDSGLENAIDAHGFSLSALAADHGGAVLHFATPGQETADIWHLTLSLPPDGQSRVALRRGDRDSPSVGLTVTVGDSVCRDLPAALSIAMELFTAVEHL